MVNDLSDKQDLELSFLLIANFEEPGVMIDAASATYLISESIKSPMGANLSGFASKERAYKVQDEYGGSVYSWEKLKKIRIFQL